MLLSRLIIHQIISVIRSYIYCGNKITQICLRQYFDEFIYFMFKHCRMSLSQLQMVKNIGVVCNSVTAFRVSSIVSSRQVPILCPIFFPDDLLQEEYTEAEINFIPNL